MTADETPTKTRVEREQDTRVDHAWRFVGWAAFFGVGYGEVVMGLDIPRYYPIGCWVIAENRYCKGFATQHGGALIAWLAKKFG